jgi:hypothetical protein
LAVGRSGYADFTNNSDASEKRFFAEKSRNSRRFPPFFRQKPGKIFPILPVSPTLSKPAFLPIFTQREQKAVPFDAPGAEAFRKNVAPRQKEVKNKENRPKILAAVSPR